MMASVSPLTYTAEFHIEHPWKSDRSSPGRWIYSHIRRHWRWFIGIIVGALGNAGGASVMSFSVGMAFNAIAQDTPDFAMLGWAMAAIVLSQLGRAVLQFWRNFSSELIGQRLERDMRAELYASLIGKSMSFHDRQSIGDVMARCTNDVREIGLFMTPGVNISIGSGAFILMAILFAPRIHPWLIVVPLGYVLCYIFLVSHYLKQLRPSTEIVRRNFGKLNSVLAESIEGIETVKGAAQEARESARFDQSLKNWRDASVAQGDLEARFLPALLFGLTMAAGILMAFALFSQGQLRIGDAIAFVMLLMLLQFPTFASQFAYPQLALGLAGAKRMLELMRDEAESAKPQLANDHAKTSPPATYQAVMRGDVEFRNITFGYAPSATPTLSNLSFKVKAGQIVAIVGQTGSGKSSIIKLINRMYDPQDGAVLIDGVDIRDWDLATLRQQISIIEQDVFLFSRTVAENIAFGVAGASQAQIETAAKAAQAHQFISEFPEGYNTVVGERGVTLSGGQRQRIAIARAFLTDPRILILDDSTSAIDSATEDQIQRAMLRAAQGRTTFIITHRLSQIRWADLIVVLRHGRIDAVGNHDELIKTSRAYKAIFD